MWHVLTSKHFLYKKVPEISRQLYASKVSLPLYSSCKKLTKKHSVIRQKQKISLKGNWCAWNLFFFLVYTIFFDEFCRRVWQKKGNNFAISHVHIMTRTKHVCYQLSHTLIGSWRTKGWKLGFQKYTVCTTCTKYSEVPNRRACSLRFFRSSSTLLAISPPCSFIILLSKMKNSTLLVY